MRSWGSTPLGGSPAPEATPASATATASGGYSNFNAPVANTTTPASAPTENGEKKKKKGKKGDKGGTGSKANSKKSLLEGIAAAQAAGAGAASTPSQEETIITAPITSTEEEPSAKKRKRSGSGSASPSGKDTIVTTATVSDKTLKRLRKNVSKLDLESEVTLSDYLSKVAKGKKDESLDRDQVLAGLKVVKKGDEWVLVV
jgi:cell growth-regulating nucleolar protein